MIHKTTTLFYWSLYAVCALLALYAGWLVSGVIATYFKDHPSVVFFLLLALALTILSLGSVIEERIIWKGRFNQTAEIPQLVARYKKNVLLDKVPSPLSLGLSLGLLAQLLV